MAIFKRFEVWLLLLLSAAGVGYVLWSENQGGDDPESPDSNPEITEEVPGRFEVREINAVPEGDHQIIEIRLVGRNDESEPETLSPDTIRLRATYPGESESTELPSFFLPFDPPPVLAPKSESIVILRYWHEIRSDQPNPSLTLEIGEESFHFAWSEGAYFNFEIGYQF